MYLLVSVHLFGLDYRLLAGVDAVGHFDIDVGLALDSARLLLEHCKEVIHDGGFSHSCAG
jgi:hypothetical protein